MFSDRIDKLWNKFSDEEKRAINLRYKTLHSEYVSLHKDRTQQKVTALGSDKQTDVPQPIAAQDS